MALAACAPSLSFHQRKNSSRQILTQQFKRCHDIHQNDTWLNGLVFIYIFYSFYTHVLCIILLSFVLACVIWNRDIVLSVIFMIAVLHSVILCVCVCVCVILLSAVLLYCVLLSVILFSFTVFSVILLIISLLGIS
jgi:hypothetical protein